MDYATLLTRQDGSCLTITLNRPARRNALSREAMAELAAALRAADADANVRTVILAGDRSCFSSGADLNEALAVRGSAECIAYFKTFHRLTLTIETLAKPVIAAIEGFCLTGGLELALACDMRIGAKGSTYGITSARIGTVPGAGATQRLPRLIGPAKALELLLSAEPISAEEAYRIGLINRLTETGDALAEAHRMAAVLAARAPLSLAYIKRAVHRGLQMDLAAGLELETSLAAEIYGTADRQEGISAFLEKREPLFRDR
jgi:enoyl-CoA hydratase/carnithine racemase